jgi:putative heme iron utilization protein
MVMSKYDQLWCHVAEQQPESMTFDEIETVLGFPIDHAFLQFKKELTVLGFQVGKISLKNKTVKFSRINTD